MIDSKLYDLNFKELLHYGDGFTAKFDFSDGRRVPCSGFCVDCEEKHLPENAGTRLTKISHAADLSDYVAVLGALENSGTGKRVMFVLEDPNGDGSFTEKKSFGGVVKEPPTAIYYWHPDCASWNVDLFNEIKRNCYGPYFVYLVKTHGFRDIYITNAVKCLDKKKSRTIASNCTARFFAREIAVFRPDLILAFGQRCAGHVYGVPTAKGLVLRLWHPSFVAKRAQTKGLSIREAVMHNDGLIKERLAMLG